MSRHKRTDDYGKRYGRLTVISHDPDNPRNLLCRCDCGRVVSVVAGNVRYGSTRSCGCLHSDFQRENCVSNFDGYFETMRQSGSNPARLFKHAVRRDSKTGVVGVTISPRSGKFVARITTNYKTIELGSYDTLAEAAEARRRAELKYHEPIVREWLASKGGVKSA